MDEGETAGRGLKMSPMRLRCALALLGLILSACSNTPTPAPTTTPVPVAPGALNATAAPRTNTPPPPPTATPAPTRGPVAARVNGQDIPLSAFEAELARYIAADPSRPDPASAAGRQLATQLTAVALDALIDRALLDQEAQRLGITISERDVDDEIKTLIQYRGGRPAFEAWLKQNVMTEDDARRMARADLVYAALRERIVAGMPRTAEYAHAWHIVLATKAEADRVRAQAVAGGNFAALAQTYSIDTSTKSAGGDLGWFTRGTGTLVWQEVETAAFALQPNGISAVVSSPIGFHVIKVTERQTRPLSADDQAALQQAAVQAYLEKLRKAATIERLR